MRNVQKCVDARLLGAYEDLTLEEFFGRIKELTKGWKNVGIALDKMDEHYPELFVYGEKISEGTPSARM